MELDLLEVYFRQLNLTLGTSVLILDVLVRQVRKILHKFSFGNLISFCPCISLQYLQKHLIAYSG